MLNFGGSQKAIYVWQKKSTIQWRKRVQSNTNRKKGTSLRFTAKKGHTAVNVCRVEYKMR